MTFAQDALQEVNILLWQQAETFEMGTNFGAFACRVAYLKTLELLRKKKKSAFLTFDSDILESLSEPVTEEDTVCDQSNALLTCMGKLSEEEQELLVLRYEKGVTVRQIAKDRNKSEGSFQQLFFKLQNQRNE